MPKFRKKSIVIEATQWFKHGDHSVVKRPLCPDPEQQKYGAILTMEGPHIVSSGDWIIKGIKGEYYPCKPDIFEATYDLVED